MIEEEEKGRQEVGGEGRMTEDGRKEAGDGWRMKNEVTETGGGGVRGGRMAEE
jgi:hypothetical protein